MADEEKKVEKKKVTLTITLPTKDDVVEALINLFPGIQVEVKEAKKPGEEVAE